MNFSLSAFQAVQRCEQQYYYGYVRRLRARVKDVAPQRGTLLHEYLATYYRALMNGVHSKDAHAAGMAHLDTFDGKLKIASAAAFYAGDLKLATDYEELLMVIKRICQRYYAARGYDDARQYEVVMVEERSSIELVAGIQSNSIIDLVLRERDGRGLTYLVEHKSTMSVPDSGLRIRDFQTILYAQALRMTHTVEVDGVLWNYLRTKEPSIPEPLKNRKVPTMSRAKDLDTTWQVYEGALIAAEINPAEYEDMRAQLEGRELNVFFPRYEHVLVADSTLLLEDYAETAKRTRTRVSEWERGVSRPIRSLTRNCDWCAYYRLCEAVVMGGDDESLIALRYTNEWEG